MIFNWIKVIHIVIKILTQMKIKKMQKIETKIKIVKKQDEENLLHLPENQDKNPEISETIWDTFQIYSSLS